MNDQLVSYIKQALAQQKSHDDVVSELLNVGWKKEDIDTAFSSVQPPTSPASPSVLGAAGQPHSETVVSDTTFATANTVVTNGGSIPASSNESTLPGIFALLKGGFAIYKARLGVLVGIGATRLLIFLFGGLLMLMGGVALFATISFVHSATLIVLIVAVISILLIGIGIAWLWYWITLASMQAVRGHEEKVGFKEAFDSARHLTWPFLWLSIVVMLVSGGGIFILSILPGTILSLLGFFSPIALIVPGVYLVGSLLILVPLFGIWFIFSGWIFLTESLHGIHALTASRELVRGRFWQILWRVSGVFFIIGVGIVLLKLILILTLVFIPMAAGTVSMLVYALFFMPFSLAVIYFLYERVRIQIPSIPVSAPRVHKTFIAYAIIGVVGIIAFIVLPPIILSRIHHSRQLDVQRLGSDSATQISLSTIEVQSAIDYAVNNNSYGSMTSIMKVPATALGWTGKTGTMGVQLFASSVVATNGDSVVAKALENAYVNANGHNVYYFANENSFFVVAKLSGGHYWCVDSNGYAGAVTTVPVAGGSCKK